jgi:hypothetical protein
MDNKSGSVLSDPAQHPVELKQIDIFFVWVNFSGEHPSAHIGFFAAKLCFGLHTAWVASRVEYGVQVPRFLLPVSIFFFSNVRLDAFFIKREKKESRTYNKQQRNDESIARPKTKPARQEQSERNKQEPGAGITTG